MKTRNKILIIGIVIITSLIFLQAPSILGQPECNDGDCNVLTNWDLIYYNIFEREYFERMFEYPPNQSKQLTKILDYCNKKGTGVPMHQPGLSFSNGTHIINNNICEWELKNEN